MDTFIQFVLSPGIFISLIFSVYYSITSRRQQDAVKRGLLGAKLNISMGVMLMFISAIQLFLSNESTLRIVLGAIFLVIGLFNLFAGIRNLSYFSMKSQKMNSQKQ